jgi:hypothetical protein
MCGRVRGLDSCVRVGEEMCKAQRRVGVGALNYGESINISLVVVEWVINRGVSSFQRVV